MFNFRSEVRRFDKSKRCLIPASAFFEFTGKKYPKAMHRFTLNNASFMAIEQLQGLVGSRHGRCLPAAVFPSRFRPPAAFLLASAVSFDRFGLLDMLNLYGVSKGCPRADLLRFSLTTYNPLSRP